MYQRKVGVTSTPQSIQDITNKDYAGTVVLQAPEDNVENVYYGTNDRQLVFIVPGGSITLPATGLHSLYVTGTAGDYVTVALIG